MRASLVFALFGSTLLLQACGENCQSTCIRVYDPSECNVVVPGVPPDDLIDQCVTECEQALKQAGTLDGYDPYNTPASDDSIKLSDGNEQWAAAWMDCVWDNAPGAGPTDSCANIDPQRGGVCAPI